MKNRMRWIPLVLSLFLTSCAISPTTTNGRPVTQLISNGALRQALTTVSEGLGSFQSGKDYRTVGSTSSNSYRIASMQTIPTQDGSIEVTQDPTANGSSLVFKQYDKAGKLLEHYTSLYSCLTTPQIGDLTASMQCKEEVLVSQYRRLGTYDKDILMALAAESIFPASTTSITFTPKEDPTKQTKQTIVQSYADGLLSRSLKGDLANGAKVDLNYSVTAAVGAVPTALPTKMELKYRGTIEATQSITLDAAMTGDSTGTNATFNIGIKGLGLLAMTMSASAGQTQPAMTGTFKDESGQELGKVDAEHQKIVYNDGKEETLDLDSIWKAMSESMEMQ